MEAWILDESPGSYRWGTIETPVPAADEVRIRIVTSALNHMDLWVTQAKPRPPLPHIPGCDAAGIIDAVGSEVTGLSVGDEVVVNPGISSTTDIQLLGNNSPLGSSFQIWGEHCRGGHATFGVIPARNVRPRPQSLSWEESAAFPLAYVTAFRMLKRARVRQGEVVLVVGVGSGVSAAAVSIARHMGLHVIATSRDKAKREQAIGLGAHETIDTNADEWNVKADVIIESVGPATWKKSISSLKPGGRLVVCGGTSGSVVEINLPQLFFKQFEIIGSSMGSYDEFDELLELINQGLPIAVDSTYPISEYISALEKLKSSEHLGKIVIRHEGLNND